MRLIWGNFNGFFKTKSSCWRRKYSCEKLKPPWNVLFFGTDNFSLASLQALKLEYAVNKQLIRKLEVVTSAKNNVIRKYALQEGLVLHNWPEVPKSSFHIGLVVSFGHLIPREIINSFPMGMLNVHASLLPRWRGAAPIIYAIAHGDQQTGVSIMKIQPHKFDVGDVLRQESVEIPKDIRMPDLHQQLAVIGAKNLVKSLKELPGCLLNAMEQPKEGVTFAPKINASMANIDFSKKTCKQIYDLARALTGVFPLLVQFDGKAVKLHNVASYEECQHSENSGSVMFDKASKVVKVYCLNGFICVDKLGVVNKKVMNASEFNNGYIKKTENRIFR